MATATGTPAESTDTTTTLMSPATFVPPGMTSRLMDIPLELRYKIFEMTAARDKAPEHVLAHWFEKRDVDQQIAAHMAAHPTGVVPVGQYTKFEVEVEQEHDGVVDDQDDEQEADHEDSEVEDEDEEDNEDDEEEDAEDDQADLGANDDNDAMHLDEDGEEDQDGDDDMMDDNSNPTTTAATVTPALSAPPVPLAGTVISVPIAPVVVASLEDELEDEEDEEDGMNEDDEEDGDGDGNDGEAIGANSSPTTAPPAPVPRPYVIHAAPKWRHIPKFMSISHCPPPMEVLLTSKELNKQAMDWFYEAAVLRIKGTASFAHPTFFEEAFQQLFDAAFSPMENIRKAEVTLVWDTAWIRASDNRDIYEAILPAFLRERTAFIVKTLKCAPMLRDLVIYWHDSLKDADSEALKYDILADFYNISATNTNVEEHFIAPDVKPLRKSKAGKFRVELMDIAERGVERLYQS
jgi:hypothetical protein